jgi:hypothetical protein
MPHEVKSTLIGAPNDSIGGPRGPHYFRNLRK